MSAKNTGHCKPPLVRLKKADYDDLSNTPARPADAQPSSASRGDAQPSSASRGDAQPSAASRGDAQPSAASRGDAQPSAASRGDAQPSAASLSDAQPLHHPPSSGNFDGIKCDFGLTGNWSKGKCDLQASLRIDGVDFDLYLHEDAITGWLDNSAGRHKLCLGRILEEVPHLHLPKGFRHFDIQPDWAVFAHQPGCTLFALALEFNLDLRKLPFFGDRLPAGHDLKIQIGIAYVKGSSSDAKVLLKNIPDDLHNRDLQTGLNVFAKMTVDGRTGTLSVPLTAATSHHTGPPKNDIQKLNTTEFVSGSSPGNSHPSPDLTKWFTLNKSIGPVTINRLGFSYRDAQIGFLVDGSVAISGLQVDLMGLGISIPFPPAGKHPILSEFHPEFHLDGLGLDYQKGTFEVGGAFLKSGTEYAGTAMFRDKTFALGALGAYAEVADHTSLFIYGFLDEPLGGVPAFFVEGLSAGFGYNQKITPPAIDDVKEFPFVKEARAQPQAKVDLGTELTSLNQYLTPELGEYFLAAGIKFTSFKQVNSFALMTVAFGEKFEIDLMGVSTLKVPSHSPEILSEIQLELLARILPEEGFVGVQAQLTPQSYVLSKDCHLQGGFAYFSWFSGEHAGDFVLTAGGYGPEFHPPVYYPQVPRLAFNWQVDDHTQIKGAEYYALTPSCFMAGGYLKATWHSGDFGAWFKMSADFLIDWKPFHYSAGGRFDFGVEATIDAFFCTLHLHFDVAADVNIHGPEFGGSATIHVSVVHFTVDFGGRRKTKPPISWDEFKQSYFLKHKHPKKNKPPQEYIVCGIAPNRGLERTLQDHSPTWIINPKELCLAVSSAVPSTTITFNKGKASVTASNVGVRPMQVDNLTSTLEVTITKDGAGKTNFAVTPVYGQVPAALWGQKNPSSNPDPNQSPIRAVTGCLLHPATPPKPGESCWAQVANLKYDVTTAPMPTDARQADYSEATDKATGKAWKGPTDHFLKELNWTGSMTPATDSLVLEFVQTPRSATISF